MTPTTKLCARIVCSAPKHCARWLSIVNQNEEDTLWIFGSSYVNVQRVNLALMKVYSSTYRGF